MEEERNILHEVAPAEGMPMEASSEDPDETIRTSVEAIYEADPMIWSDREAIDHFGFIPEGVRVPSTEKTVRFPAWREG